MARSALARVAVLAALLVAAAHAQCTVSAGGQTFDLSQANDGLYVTQRHCTVPPSPLTQRDAWHGA